MNVLIQSNLEKFQKTLGVYLSMTHSRTLQSILQHKTRDISFKLFKAFRQHRWRGSGRGMQGIAWREMRRRAKEGAGTEVRENIQPSENAPGFYIQRSRVRTGYARGKARFQKIGMPHATSVWQKKVFAELMLRQQGIGFLGAAFLFFHRSEAADIGVHFAQNRKGVQLGYASLQQGAATIVGSVKGLEEVQDRYGIIAQVLIDSAADMQIYIDRKLHEDARKYLGGEGIDEAATEAIGIDTDFAI